MIITARPYVCHHAIARLRERHAPAEDWSIAEASAVLFRWVNSGTILSGQRGDSTVVLVTEPDGIGLAVVVGELLQNGMQRFITTILTREQAIANREAFAYTRDPSWSCRRGKAAVRRQKRNIDRRNRRTALASDEADQDDAEPNGRTSRQKRRR